MFLTELISFTATIILRMKIYKMKEVEINACVSKLPPIGEDDKILRDATEDEKAFFVLWNRHGQTKEGLSAKTLFNLLVFESLPFNGGGIDECYAIRKNGKLVKTLKTL